MKRSLLFISLSLLLLSLGCTHVLSPSALQQVDPTLDFGQVKANPQAYQGKAMILGGLIIQAQPSQTGTTLEILRYTLDRWGEPLTVDEAGGRFLARSERFLDPELYKSGRFVTLSGIVAGTEVRPLQSYEYVYPVFRIVELHLWTRSPSYYYYPHDYYPWGPYPYYYGEPYWYYDPYWPYPYWRRPPWW